MMLKRRNEAVRARCAGLFVLTALTFLMSAAPARGLDPKKAITQYIHEAFHEESWTPAGPDQDRAWSRGGGVARGTRRSRKCAIWKHLIGGH